MKKSLFVLLNKCFKKDLEYLYGVGSHVEITNVFYSTNKKIHIIQAKLYIGDLNLFEKVNELGLNYLFEEAWIVMGNYKDKFLKLKT